MDSKLNMLKNILEKPLELRDTIDLNLIASYIVNVKFFESLKDQKSIFKECCKYINYELVLKGQYVFKEGEVGDKFYILLKGIAGVIITIKEKDNVSYKEVLEYTDGSSFGELALKDNKPRAASILAKSDCHFAVLDKFNYNRILASILIKKRNELVEFLRNQSFFKNLTKGSVLKLSYCFDERSLKKDQVLYKEGEACEYLYLIREGQVKLSQTIKIEMFNSDEPVTKGMIFLKKFLYRKANLGIIEAGEMLGLNDLDNETYSSTCVCFSATVQVLAIQKKDFKRRINNQESINLINTGVMLRDSIHQNSIKSVTKIIKERVHSPYKRIFLEETVGKNIFDDKSEGKKKLLIQNKNSNSESNELDKELEGNLSFDLLVNSNKSRKKRLYEEVRFIKPRCWKLDHSESKGNSLDSRSQKLSRLKKSVKLPNEKFAELRTSMETSPETVGKQISIRKVTMKSLISKLQPFGRTPVTYTVNKDTEVVNIHTPRKNLSLQRPNTPRNWYFRNEVQYVKRPSTNHGKNKC